MSFSFADGDAFWLANLRPEQFVYGSDVIFADAPDAVAVET